jgi:hypothetical protein
MFAPSALSLGFRGQVWLRLLLLLGFGEKQSDRLPLCVGVSGEVVSHLRVCGLLLVWFTNPAPYLGGSSPFVG